MKAELTAPKIRFVIIEVGSYNNGIKFTSEIVGSSNIPYEATKIENMEIRTYYGHEEGNWILQKETIETDKRILVIYLTYVFVDGEWHHGVLKVEISKEKRPSKGCVEEEEIEKFRRKRLF